MVVLLGEFNLFRVELPYTRYLVAFVDECGCLSLRFRKDDVNEVLCSGDYSDLLEVVVRHLLPRG